MLEQRTLIEDCSNILSKEILVRTREGNERIGQTFRKKSIQRKPND